MRLNRIFARFYKSFNFDHVRKAAGGRREPWEMWGDDWYPFVEVPVDGRITAVVGANESGKSQLLGAVRLAITGRGFRSRDLCRYSDFFGVEEGSRISPHVGAEWTHLSETETTAVQALLEADAPIDRFLMFRFSEAEVSIWTGNGDDRARTDLTPDQVKALEALLPQPFEIGPDIALPASMPLDWLAERQDPSDRLETRRDRRDLNRALGQLRSIAVGDAGSITQNAAALVPVLSSLTREGDDLEARATTEQMRLVENLLFRMARIDRSSFLELAEAVADGEDGFANGLVEKLNDQIERALNLRKWWAQDREFSLRLSMREHDVAFTIRDRTDTEYTFAERSHGLRYFLSYLIQSQAASRLGRPLVLLMDEPDAHLSAEAQQDLLRIFENLVDPSGAGRAPMQVIYVTHSPFLLDKNHAERIRVVEKGRNLDGTRVIPTVAHNHYEPLRSAFGAFVGETAFVGSVNLVVEGPADQILLAGAARLTRRMSPGVQRETLDLNRLVIVPAGSASQVPYMVYLIRGRDAERPPVLVLLDSDAAGTDAADFMRKDPKYLQLIANRFVMQLGDTGFDLADPVLELEDLLPPALAVAAANRCLSEMFTYREKAAPQITEADLAKTKPGPMFDRLEAAVKAKRARLGKVALARAVVELADDEQASSALASEVGLWLQRMRKLFGRLNAERREAEERTQRHRNARLVEDRVRMFEQDHGTSATREEVDDLLDAIFIQLDDSPEADMIRQLGQELRGLHRLSDDPGEPVADFEAMLASLRSLKDAPQLLKARVRANAKQQVAAEQRPASTRRRRAAPAKGAD